MKECRDRSSEPSRKGHHKFLTCTDHLLLLGLVSDLLGLQRGFQLQCQSDTITLDELQRHVEHMIADLEELKETPLLGGWKAEIRKNVVLEDGIQTFFGEPLWKKEAASRLNKYVSVACPFSAVRVPAINKLL